MNRPLAQCIVEALCVSGSSEDCLARLGSFGLGDWQRTLPWLDDSGLALYLLERISHSEFHNAFPVRIEARLRRNLASNQQRVAEMKREFASLNLGLEAAGVEYAVLKGFALAPDYCPDAALRTQYDYDYLVHPKSVKIAQQTLRAAGYSQKIKSPGFQPAGESLFANQPLSLPLPDHDFYSVNIPRAVELHVSLWQTERDMIGLEAPEDALDRKRTGSWDSLRFPVLAEDDGLIFQSLHAFQHLLSYWCRPSWFLEIAHFMAKRRSDEAFWEQFRSRVNNRRCLPEIVALVFSMAETLFGAPVPAQVRTWLAANLPSALSLWVRRYGRKCALAGFPGSKLTLFVHREFIHDPAIWKKVQRGRLLPFHRPAHVTEPGNPSLTSHWKASWDQWRFVLRRFQFHLGALLSYGWELPRWKRILSSLHPSQRDD